MKLNLITALLLTASVAMAASETTTTSATATVETHGKSASAPAHGKKKAKKAKKDKKAEKDEATTSPAPAPSSQTAPMQGAQQIAAAAAGTSTATAQPVASAKKWGVVLLNESSIDYAGGKDMANAPVNTTNYVGGSYKITTNEKLGLRQYFNYKYDPNSEKDFESTDIKQSFTVATISTKTKGILGSEDIAPTFWYYMPGRDAEVNTFGKDMDAFYGLLRADIEVAWTLNPLWSVSYYMNPRQSLGAKDASVNFEPTSRLVHYANLYYNISDAAQLYANAGLDHRMSTERLTSTADTYLSAVGASFSFLGGKLTLNPEINTSTDLKKNGVAQKSQNLYKKENIGYTLATVIAL